MVAFAMSLGFGILYAGSWYGLQSQNMLLSVVSLIIMISAAMINISAILFLLMKGYVGRGLTLVPVFLPIVVLVFLFDIGEKLSEILED